MELLSGFIEDFLLVFTSNILRIFTGDLKKFWIPFSVIFCIFSVVSSDIYLKVPPRPSLKVSAGVSCGTYPDIFFFSDTGVP